MWTSKLILVAISFALNYWPHFTTSSELTSSVDNQSGNTAMTMKSKPKFSSWSTELAPAPAPHQATQLRNDFDSIINQEKTIASDNVSSGENLDHFMDRGESGGNSHLQQQAALPSSYDQKQQSLSPPNGGALPTGLVTRPLLESPTPAINLDDSQGIFYNFRYPSMINTSTTSSTINGLVARQPHWPASTAATTITRDYFDHHPALTTLNSLDRIDRIDDSRVSSISPLHHFLISNLLRRAINSADPSNLSSLLNNIPISPNSGELMLASATAAAHDDNQSQLRNLLRPFYFTQSAGPNRGPWVKTLVARRRSAPPHELPSPSPPLETSSGRGQVKLDFDDPIIEPAPIVRVTDGATNPKRDRMRRDYLATALAHHQLPWTHDQTAPSSKSSKFINFNANGDGESLIPLVDNNLIQAAAGSRYSYHHTLPRYPYLHYNPAYAPHAHHNHKSVVLSPRKGLDRLVGVPVLIGIGAGLISSLIISNLFLSIPLFAMTLMQFLNGNSGGIIIPNNAMPSNNNNNNSPQPQPQPSTPVTPTGRKKRQVNKLEFEDRIMKAIHGHY